MLTFSSWTDRNGVAWTNPVFTLGNILISKDTNQASFVIRGYISEAQIGNLVLEERSYILSGADYTAFVGAAMASIPTGSTPRPVVTLDDALRAQAYLFALNKQDVVATPTVPAIPAVLDSNGNIVTPAVDAIPAVMKSFFDGAMSL